jgi:PAS domain S-box-containing protein
MNAFKSLVGKLRRGFSPVFSMSARDDSQLGYHDLVRSLREVMFQTDLHGILTFLSPNWEKLTGLRVRQSIGNRLSDYMHPEDRSRFLEYTT